MKAELLESLLNHIQRIENTLKQVVIILERSGEIENQEATNLILQIA